MNADYRVRVYKKILRLRLVTAFVWAIGTIVYTTMIWHTSEKGVVFHPFVMLVPSSIMVGFAVNAFERKCPKCNEKFYGDILRFLSAKSCRYCDYHGT